jgi:hypothetical protein
MIAVFPSRSDPATAAPGCSGIASRLGRWRATIAAISPTRGE